MHRRFLSLLFFVAAPAAAQRPDTSHADRGTAEVMADEVVVQAVRSFAATARVTELPLRETSSVADALARGTTAFVRPLGLTGLASMSLRGTGAAHTAVLLDGLRLTDPQLGQIDLRMLPSALFSSATLVHGLGSAYDGSDAVGGTLHLETTPADGWGGAVEGGSFGTYRADGRVGTRIETGRQQVRVSAAASAEIVRGDFPYFDPIARSDARRTGADAQHASLLLRAATPRTAAGLWVAAADRGLLQNAGTPPQGERQTDGLARVWASHTRPLQGGALRVAAYAHASRLRYVHPGRSIDETGRTQTLGGEAERTWVLARGWEGEPMAEGALGVSASTATAQHPSLASDAREHTLAAFAHTTRRRGRWTVAAAVRQDAYLRADRSFFPVSPRLGVRYEIGGGFSGKASAATSFRAPTLNDRFWAGAGRPDLRPERGLTADAGLAFRRVTGVEVWEAEATLFAHTLRDQIVWTPGANGLWRPENLSRTRAVGLEASGRWHLRDDFGRPTVEGSLAATDAVDRSDAASPSYGQPLRYVPRLVARLGGRVDPGRYGVEAALHYTGLRYTTSDASQSLPPVLTVHLGASVRLGGLRLGLRLDNALDARYQMLDGFPMPGRAAYVRLSTDP